MIRNIALIALSLVLFVACFNKADKTNIATLNTLQHNLDSAKKVFENIDLIKAQEVEQEIANDVEFVKQNDESLVKDSVFIKYYGLYSGAGRSISRLLRGNFINYGSKIESCEQQISTLKRDLKRDLIPNDSIVIYMESENAASKEVMNRIYKVEHALNMQMESYAYSKNEIKAILNKVKKQKALD